MGWNSKRAVGHGRRFVFDSKCNGKFLKTFELESDTIKLIYILKSHLDFGLCVEKRQI